MKLFITMIALAFPLFASANTVVFQATSAAPETLKTLSFDSAYLTDDAGQLILTAGNLAGSFQTVSAVRMTEDAISFKAEKLLLNSWESGCGEAEFAKASIEGVSVLGAVEAKNLKISIQYTTVHDVCHSQPQTQLIKYQLVQ